MLSELYGSKYDKILINITPFLFYRLMSKSTRKTSITLYVFLHEFDKQSKESDIAVLSYSLPFTFFLPAGMLPCAAYLSTTSFARGQNWKYDRLTHAHGKGQLRQKGRVCYTLHHYFWRLRYFLRSRACLRSERPSSVFNSLNDSNLPSSISLVSLPTISTVLYW